MYAVSPGVRSILERPHCAHALKRGFMIFARVTHASRVRRGAKITVNQSI